jgi:hypothetical protein
MPVALWHFADCPNWRVAGQRLRQVRDEIGRTDARVRFEPVQSEAGATSVGFAGSPMFTVDGVDLFDAAAPAGALACRVRPTPDGFAGVPEVSDLVAALTEKVTS